MAMTNCSWDTTKWKQPLGFNTATTLATLGYGTDVSDHTVFYDTSATVYAQGGANAWDFDTPVWYEVSGSYPVLKLPPSTASNITTRYGMYNEVWFVVNRGGQRYIERMDQRMKTYLRKDQFFVDCGITQDHTTATDTYLKFLAHFDNLPFSDELGNVITRYNSIPLDDTIYKYGTGSVSFNGTSHYVGISDSVDWSFGTGNFTIDAWVRLATLDRQQVLFGQYANATSCWYIQLTSDNKLEMKFVNAVTKGKYTMASAWSGVSIDSWYHLAFERIATDGMIFINGVAQGLTAATTFGTSDVGDIVSDLYVGQQNATSYFNGWIDELRITKGFARWNTDFYPPEEAYTTTGGTSSVVTGLAHLNGQDVAILADGGVCPQQTVSGGTVTLSNAASLVHVGLPYFADLETLNIEVGMPDGTLQGRRINVSRVILRLANSRGGWIGPDFSELYELMGTYKTSYDIPLYTDDVKVNLGQGYKDGGRLCFRQVDPLPITILGVMPIITVGGTTLID
jgi:hypothetical protein